MTERLPHIDVAVKGKPEQVLRALASTAEQLDTGEVEVVVDSMAADEMLIANIRCKHSAPHKGLGLQFIYYAKLRDRIAVEVRAARWQPDDPPKYETYVQAARDVAGPVLKAYNASHGTSYRLRIPKPASLVRNLSPASAELFATFIRHANTSALHPKDWGRFYKFVWGSRGSPLHEEDMIALLVSKGFSSEYAERVASIYVHLCDFKAYK